MTSNSGPNYSVDNQITFIVQWFRTWSELQKDDFVEILAQKLSPAGNMNGLVNGMQKLDTGSRRVSLFSCQVKLFNEWWATWSEAEKENLTTRLKESDPKFWATVQAELSGARKKVEDDFFTLIGNCTANVAEAGEPGATAVVEMNGTNNGESSDNDNQPKVMQNGTVTVTVNGCEPEEVKNAEEDEGMEAEPTEI